MSLWSTSHLSCRHSALAQDPRHGYSFHGTSGVTGFGMPDTGPAKVLSDSPGRAVWRGSALSQARALPRCHRGEDPAVLPNLHSCSRAHGHVGSLRTCCERDGVGFDQQRLAVVSRIPGSIWPCRGLSVSIPLARSGHAVWEARAEEPAPCQECRGLAPALSLLLC